MRKFLFAATAVCFLATSAWAAKTTYIATNHRFNYVKLKEVKGIVAEERMMTHPVKIDEQGLRAALASIKLARSFLVKKEVDTQEVFDEQAINFLAPAMVRAFAEASPGEEVLISYLSKNPLIILRNDHLNIAQAWVSGNELHIKFNKLYAKVTGDIDKRGNESKAAAKARGLRVKLDLGTGQKMALKDPEEIILDLDYNYVQAPETKVVTEGITMTGERVPLAGAPDVEAKAETKSKVKSKDAAAEGGTVSPPSVSNEQSAEERLERLDELKEKGLISKKEYKEKRKEILNDL